MSEQRIFAKCAPKSKSFDEAQFFRKNENYMAEEEIKEYLWREFKKFMAGQTVAMNKRGKYLYYKSDVNNFLTNPEKRFFD